MEKTAFDIGFIDGIEKIAEEMSGKKKALIGAGVAAGGTAAGLSGLGHAMGGGASPMGGLRAIRHAHEMAVRAGKGTYARGAADAGSYASRFGRALRVMRAAAK